MAAAAFIQEIARELDVPVGVVERASHAAAYAKSWDAIESLLALAGASETVLALEERAVVADARSRANRLANADHANLVRTSRAAELQVEAVRRLGADGVLERLPDDLREAAALRLRHPTDSLRELAARTDPAVSKAAMHRRLRRLADLAGV